MALSKCWRAAKNSEGLGTTVKLWSNFLDLKKTPWRSLKGLP